MKDAKRFKMEIPCKFCICLAICKWKEQIYCNILYDFMDTNTCYDDAWDGKMTKGHEAWQQFFDCLGKQEKRLIGGGPARKPTFAVSDGDQDGYK